MFIFYDFPPVFDRFSTFLTIFRVKNGHFYRILLIIRDLRILLRLLFASWRDTSFPPKKTAMNSADTRKRQGGFEYEYEDDDEDDYLPD